MINEFNWYIKKYHYDNKDYYIILCNNDIVSEDTENLNILINNKIITVHHCSPISDICSQILGITVKYVMYNGALVLKRIIR